jgi:hypothetical protein
LAETSSYKLPKAKTPARTQGFFQFQMVARGGIDRGLRMSDPSRHQLVNLVMIPNIDRNDFIISNNEFKRNPVLQVDRDTMQTGELSFEAM